MKKAISILLWVVAIAASGVYTYSKSRREVVFVIPDDFRGFILLLEDAERGIEIPKGKPVLNIPSSGVLRVKSFDFFPKRWYTQVPRRASGTSIPTSSEPTLAPNRTYFRSLGSNTPSDQMFFVGTGAECKALQSSPFEAVYRKVELMEKEARESSRATYFERANTEKSAPRLVVEPAGGNQPQPEEEKRSR
jgi:hypothetical protein